MDKYTKAFNEEYNRSENSEDEVQDEQGADQQYAIASAVDDDSEENIETEKRSYFAFISDVLNSGFDNMSEQAKAKLLLALAVILLGFALIYLYHFLRFFI